MRAKMGFGELPALNCQAFTQCSVISECFQMRREILVRRSLQYRNFCDVDICGRFLALRSR